MSTIIGGTLLAVAVIVIVNAAVSASYTRKARR